MHFETKTIIIQIKLQLINHLTLHRIIQLTLSNSILSTKIQIIYHGHFFHRVYVTQMQIPDKKKISFFCHRPSRLKVKKSMVRYKTDFVNMHELHVHAWVSIRLSRDGFTFRRNHAF